MSIANFVRLLERPESADRHSRLSTIRFAAEDLFAHQPPLPLPTGFPEDGRYRTSEEPSEIEEQNGAGAAERQIENPWLSVRGLQKVLRTCVEGDFGVVGHQRQGGKTE